jgi:hypothetical protein
MKCLASSARVANIISFFSLALCLGCSRDKNIAVSGQTTDVNSRMTTANTASHADIFFQRNSVIYLVSYDKYCVFNGRVVIEKIENGDGVSVIGNIYSGGPLCLNGTNFRLLLSGGIVMDAALIKNNETVFYETNKRKVDLFGSDESR